ncbi:cytosine deaminase [Pseudomonas frederiksbergensis]|uniref:Cytosine deaminase n=1 Tax=Pseudomonas frederiksbergensis TaxID=104087 RepID=A0A1J0EKJ6_9PSED|nr:nucleoside deaminase [Pseudomonas frederiksbergensis]APC16487.1 cytosine deaminase [Pseudomonas frederiksbergensis]
MTPLKSAQEAVTTVANQAILAAMQKTFAVGGAIINNATGEVIAALHNNVLMPFPGSGTTYFLPHDPTAHGERQLVDWYYEKAASLKLPPPDQLTIVTTLDPCAMCAGALLTAGFNVAVSAIDDYAGVNYNSQFTFPSLPPHIRQQAQKTWAYYAVAAPVSRAYQGSMSPVFGGQTIDSAAYYLTSSIFSASVNTVREASNNSGLEPSKLKNPATLPANSPVRQALTQLSPYALTVTSSNPRDPGAELAPPLLKTAQQANVFNSVALLDPFGNLLVCLGGVENQSPIRTAFMETTRSYAVMRWTLMNDPDPAVRAQAEQYLTHPKYGTFVFLYAPDPTTPQAVMTLGAYGSTMEGQVPQSYPSNLQYVLLPGNTTAQALSQLAQNLPPFYTQSVQVAPAQVLSQALINAVKSGV